MRNRRFILANSKGTKNIFCSLTFWSLFFLALEGTATHLEAVLTDGQLGIKDVFSILRIVAATGAGFLGRYNAEGIIYTPKGLPGRDLSQAERLSGIVEEEGA